MRNLSRNSKRPASDTLGVDCSDYRDALSARIDGEHEPLSPEVVDRHLAECFSCKRWNRDAVEVSRALRVRPAESTPDLTEAILDATAATGRGARRWPRVLLACVAVCQLALGLMQLVGLGHAPMHGESMSGHLFNESTSWNIALGLGLLFSAIRTRISTGLVPVLGAFLVVLTGFSALDLVHGAVPASRLLSHGFLVLGLVLLLLVRRDRERETPEPSAVGQPATGSTSSTDGPEDPPAGDGSRRLRPVTYRRAA